MKLGVLGLGEHVKRSHLPFLPRPVAYYDPSTGQAQHDFPREASEDALLAREDIDTILIGSPDRFHAAQLLKAVKAGKHVFVEKPLAVDEVGMGQVRLALSLAEEKKLLVSSCHPRRYDPPVAWLKEHIEMSHVTKFVFRFCYHQVTDPWKKNRSLMLDHLGHELDLVCFLFGVDTIEALEALEDSHACYRVRGKVGHTEILFEGTRMLEESLYLEFMELWVDDKCTRLNLNNGLMLDFDGMEHAIPCKNYDTMFECVNHNFLEGYCGAEPLYLTHQELLRNNGVPVKLWSVFEGNGTQGPSGSVSP